MSPIPAEDKVILEPAELAAAQLQDWRVVSGQLRTRFLTRTFMTGVDLVNRIAAAAEAADHHPDIDLRYPHVDVAMSSHDVNGLTRRDIRLARTVSEIAAALGVAAQPAD